MLTKELLALNRFLVLLHVDLGLLLEAGCLLSFVPEVKAGWTLLALGHGQEYELRLGSLI